MAGTTRASGKQSFWHRLFHNQWIVVGGIGVIAIGTIFATLCSAQLGTTSGASSVREGRIEETATPEGTATGTATATATSTATATPTVQRRFAAAPEIQIDPNKQYFATIKTEKGDIRLELYAKDAPQAVNNFVFLARRDFYDGLTFHRVIDGFVAQGGDPDGTGAGGPGYTLPDEKNSLKHEAGVIAMARSAQGASGSQFYITMTPQYGLDAQGFTPFGRVVEGMDVLQRLTRRDTSRNPRAAPGDQITEVVIEER